MIDARRQSRRYLGNASLAVLLICSSASAVVAADIYLPIVMPITGFLSVEGGS